MSIGRVPTDRTHARGQYALLTKLLLLLLGIAVPVIFVEAATALLLAYPSLARSMPRAVIDHLRDCYNHCWASMPHMQRDAGRYDPQLYYTLHPGHFVFRAPEFATEYRI